MLKVSAAFGKKQRLSGESELEERWDIFADA